MIKAIETRYKGYRFRSRLEARWAVFFDALGIKWEYEPEGFEKTVGEKTFRYLPDFWLPDLKLWVEVKGKMSVADAQLMSNFEELFNVSTSRLVVLGNIPDPEGHAAYWHRVVESYDTTFLGCWGGWMYQSGAAEFRNIGARNSIDFEGMSFELPMHAVHFLSDSFTDEKLMRLFTNETGIMDIGKVGRQRNPEVTAAYKAARSARFEHGQSGGVL